ncbi:pentapeptide repeat-containing protein [Anaerovorax odorimutans]|uniref:Pentapeptide repeat-containing protein n=1 Tax=Anaerovorax odorimutans TaxID=109327 RepID=A0ABT1RQV9_9FIRM|nr:pentapeptide repeat-containing protein [Anaerovorax odorimutans]MCQ4637582.1 pentapeptide repeat-containing protein [Anaerovorax odorimutans]
MNDFTGKYCFQAGADGLWVTVDEGNKVLRLSGSQDGNSRFNFYGSAGGASAIQAMNGCYVTEDEEYAAALPERKDAAAFFLEAGEKAEEVVIYRKLSNHCRSYLNVEDGQLRPCIKGESETPPHTARFICKELSYGLKRILSEGAKGQDLSRVDFSGLVLRGIDLRKATVQNADFSRADLTSALLRESDFSGSSFAGAVLRDAAARRAIFAGCNLIGCAAPNMGAEESDFQRADLSSADLRNVSFIRANLSKAILRKCCLTYATMVGIDLRGADLTGGEMAMVSFSQITTDHETVFNEVSARRSNFRHQDLAGVSMAHGDFRQSYFDGANLTKADLSYADLKECSFGEEAILSGACLANCRLAGARFVGAQLAADGKGAPPADLTGAYMPDAVMKDSNLMGVNMSGVNWYGINATAEGSHMERVDFSNAVLSTMKFTQADLNGCVFDRANLICTNFRGARLRPADGRNVSFSYANIQGADFFESEIVDAAFSNAAACQPAQWLFSVEGKQARDCRQDLNNGGKPLSQRVRELFCDKGLTLPEKAVSQVYLTDCYWRICAEEDCLYTVTMEYDQLQVRGGIPGVHLFTVEDRDGSIRRELQQSQPQVPKKLTQAFSDAGYRLNPSASVAGCGEEGQVWSIDNDLHSQSQLQTGYLEFCVSLSGKDQLRVFGTVLGTLRVGEGHVYEQQRDVMLATKWVPDLLRGNSLCPSGQNISIVTDPRPAVRKTWDDVMTADRLPKEPECIPDPFHWCEGDKGGARWK